MAHQAPKKLLVLGGSGFVGREICRRAIKVGFEVTSLTRRGRVPYTFLASDDVTDWESQVKWRAGNAAHKEIMQSLIAQHDAVIHTIGIMFENSFNTLVSGSRSDATGISYEIANMETALVSLSVIEQQESRGRRKPFIFISAASAPPFLKRYLTTKLQVEKRMKELAETEQIRSVIFRPGSKLDRLAEKKLGISVGVPEPTPLDLLSTAVVRAAARPDIQGTFTNKEMWELTAGDEPQI